jgi:rhodanese-related sulfurtransferase
MAKTYIGLTIVAILVAAGLLFLPDHKNFNEVKPDLLFKEINDPARFLSADLVAERLINEDPSIMLIDVRTSEQFTEYSLPRSINIPLDKIFEPEWKDYLLQDNIDVVLYSNSDLYADQVWILYTRIGYKNLYVLKGGLNQWFKDIMQPIPPPETTSSEAFDLYSFRKAASQYFGGGSQAELSADQPKKEVPIIKRTRKRTTAGGC